MNNSDIVYRLQVEINGDEIYNSYYYTEESLIQSLTKVDNAIAKYKEVTEDEN